MVPVMSLWVPILLSAVIVFVASSVIHMLLPIHKSDFRKLPDEDGVMDALRKAGVGPGDYMFPHAGSMADLKSPAFTEKRTRGPVASMTVMESGPVSMGPSLAQWFLYCVVVGVFAAYVAGRALPAGAEHLAVFRFVGTTAFLCYAVGLWHMSIWYSRSWITTIKDTVDGLVYGLLTAGVFAWLWPS